MIFASSGAGHPTHGGCWPLQQFELKQDETRRSTYDKINKKTTDSIPAGMRSVAKGKRALICHSSPGAHSTPFKVGRICTMFRRRDHQLQRRRKHHSGRVCAVPPAGHPKIDFSRGSIRPPTLRPPAAHWTFESLTWQIM